MKKIALLVFFLAACSSAPKQESTFKPLPVQDLILPNGLKMVIVRDNSLPRFAMQLVIRAGSRLDPVGKEGLNSLTASLLDQGTKTLSAQKLALALNELGAEISQSANAEATTIAVSGLTRNRKGILDLFTDVVLHPAFDPSEINRVRDLTIAAQKQIADKPSSYLDYRSDQIFFQNHPYGRFSSGTPKSLLKLGRTDLMDHYHTFFRPNRAWLVLTGQIDDEFLTEVRSQMSAWKALNEVATYARMPLTPVAPQLRLIHRSEVVQSDIRLMLPGIARGDEDEFKLMAASSVLGSGFESRLIRRLREELGLVYGASSVFNNGLDVGVFELEAATKLESTATVVFEMRKVLQEFVKDGITEKELAAFQNLAIGQFPASIQTPEQLASALVRQRLFGLGDDRVLRYPEIIRSLNVKQVNEAIRKRIDPSKAIIVVSSNQDKVLSDLVKVGETPQVELVQPIQ